VIDIDLRAKQVYGTSWFTLFSPRIQHYTIGVEPVAPDWVADLGAQRDAYPVVMSWMGRPDSGRSRGQGLFRRSYEYATNFEGGDARLRGVPTGLKGVPIQVWSTKSFTATWQALPARPLFASKLRPAGNDHRELEGEITSEQPIRLDDAVLIHAPDTNVDRPIRVYDLGTLLPNTARRITTGGLVPKDGYFTGTELGQTPTFSRGGRRWNPNPVTEPTSSLVKRALFFELVSQRSDMANMTNRSLRSLDQSWRVRRNPNEVIIYGRLTPSVGQAEDMTQDPVSPSRLWLGALPGRGAARPTLSGTLRQETYVRVFIPIDTRP
jgi:hypothetical protein